MLAYAAKDSKVLLPLHNELTRLIEEAGGTDWVGYLEERLLKAVVQMADNVVPIDREKWAGYIETVEQEKEDLVRKMDAHVSEYLPEEIVAVNTKNKNVPEDRNDKVNWQGDKQKAWALSSLSLDLPLTEKGNPSTGKEALKDIDHPLARLVERFNRIKNVPKTFGKALKDRVEGDWPHCDWHQNEARSGRMSCRNPPLQGAPSEGELRKAVKAPPGSALVVSDLSRIEVRVLAALSGDKAMKEAFK
jgi:DNA polymerase I-like protein with 3'-5' exonuclease and polymerase domains